MHAGAAFHDMELGVQNKFRVRGWTRVRERRKRKASEKNDEVDFLFFERISSCHA